MLRPEAETNEAARDIRAALASLKGPGRPGLFHVKTGFSPDEACADFAAHHAGLPARPRPGAEPAVLYKQRSGPDLLLGLYGCEERLKSWLPGIAGRPMPEVVRALAPCAPINGTTDHIEAALDLTALPFPKITPRDAGPYVTMGFVMTGCSGAGLALSAHRMLVLDKRRLGISMLTSRALRHRALEAHAKGHDLPISVNIGVPPAVAVASATATAHLPPAFDKLSLAGALAGAPVQLAEQTAPYLPQSDFVLHGRLTAQTVPETLGDRPKGVTLPEFLGYDGHAGPDLMVIEIDEITHRPGGVLQSCLGPGKEQSSILSLGGALALALSLQAEGGLSQIADIRFAAAGGGMLLLYVALKSGAAEQLDLAQLSRRLTGVMPFTKTIVFVDDDVDLSSDEDVLWAMTTRCNLARDTHAIEDLPPLRMDPSQGVCWQEAGGSAPCRSWVNATVPSGLKEQTWRSFPETPEG
ncbi:UbiD family decarboxylase [Pacificoceanicola onchidii]|uniref:UbiD family decarboxylase n=1 Tax=Pacificoceanicola onchidii TaxID=2562685 RepID=UPI001455DCCA|nr:UbiD family decarboxylase [Pacificoceanicola onchidii]